MMYGNLTNNFDDFIITLDDLLIGRIINKSSIRKLSEDDYLILRAELRSEILFSSAIHEELREKSKSFIKAAEIIPDFGDNIFDLGKSIRQYGGLAATNTLTRVGFDVPEFNLMTARSSYMGGGHFSYFDSLLLEKFIPIQTLASMSPTKQKAICSMIKLEIATSRSVEELLDSKIEELQRGKK